MVSDPELNACILRVHGGSSAGEKASVFRHEKSLS